MGVTHLQTYLEHGMSKSVSVKSLAEDFRRENGNRDPEIVVDAFSCIRKIYGAQGKLDWVCGGQFAEFADQIKHFIQCFKRLDIQLTFFFDGTLEPSKRAVWTERRIRNMKKVHKILDTLKNGGYFQPMGEDFILPEALGYVMSHIITKCGSKVQMSVIECDNAMASYAKENNCLAILASDSDFAIYQYGARHFLSLHKLDLSNMTTLCYDSREMVKTLSLSLSALPLVASLMGNDVVPYNDLKKFHLKLTGESNPHVSVLLPKIAKYVKKFPGGTEIFPHLLQISEYVFGKDHRASDLKRSILSYIEDKQEEQAEDGLGLESEWKELLDIARERFINMTAPSCIFNILRGQPLNMSTVLEDYRNENQNVHPKPSAVLLRKIRQRIYGVLLKDSPTDGDKNLTVAEFCMSGPKSLENPVSVLAEKPPQEVSFKLLDVWKQCESQQLQCLKLKLLVWMTSQTLYLKNYNLSHLPHKIIAPVCALSFLYKDASVLNKWEVKVFASSIIELQSMNVQELSILGNQQVLNVRAVILATLFARTITHIFWANAVCGNPVNHDLMLHHSVFDGKLFQAKYLEVASNQASPNPKRGSQFNFEKLCDAVLK